MSRHLSRSPQRVLTPKNAPTRFAEMAYYVPTTSALPQSSEHTTRNAPVRDAFSMVHPSPWIANTIVDSLKVYLSPDSQTLTETQLNRLPFGFRHDNSNLFITVKNEQAHGLSIIKWESTLREKSVKAYVTDGECGIWATFSWTALNSDLSSTKNPVLTVGAILLPTSFEIRLADHVSPPKVLIHLIKFHLIERPSTPHVTKLPTIYDNKVASRYLCAWKLQEELWRMEAYPDSPLGLRSQVGEGGGDSDVDVHDQNLVSTSQAQFATQIPLKSTQQHSVSRVQQSSRVTEPIKNTLIGRLVDQEVGATKSGQAHFGQSIEASLQKAIVISTEPDLTQRQIVPPSSDLSPARAQNYKVRKDEARTVVSEKEIDPSCERNFNGSQNMPLALVNLLRDLRKECGDSRYVPRRLQIIPKDQLMLLESDDRWQPPLVGRSQRPGAVPLELLNRLSREADLQKSLSEADNPTHEEAEEVNAQAAIVVQHETESSPCNRSNSGSEPSESPVEWSSSPPEIHPSPPEIRRVLPQDTPPYSNHNRAVGVTSEDALPTGGEVDKDIAFSEGLRGGTQVNSQAHRNLPISADPRKDFSQISKRRLVSNMNEPKDEVSLPPPSTLPAQPKSMTDKTPRTVQVKRTPYPTKEVMSHHHVPDSSVKMIPGTFDNRSEKMRHGLEWNKIDVLSNRHRTSCTHANDFEANSSEDEASTESVHDSKSQPKRVVSMNSTSTPVSLSETSSKMTDDAGTREPGGHNAKRKHEVGDLRSSKRFKVGEHKISTAKSIGDPDYGPVDDDRKHHRRQMLSKISRQHVLIEPSLSPETRSGPRKDIGESQVLNQQALKRTSPIRTPIGKNTPEIDSRMLQDVQRNSSLQPLRKSFSTASDVNDVSLEELYARFRSAYPTYGGQMKHFIATCSLLRNLHLQGRATHPSLWDDFIFRHHHDYREHLQDVIENCGSALSYEKFYEDCVEQPTHLCRIVKPLQINTMQLPAGSSKPATPSVNVVLQNDTPPGREGRTSAMLDIPMATDSSMSNVIIPTDAVEQTVEDPIISGHTDEAVQQNPQHQDAEKTIPQDQDHSQESCTSIRMWLEKAAGAESPILGTAEAVAQQNVDVSMIDLTPSENKIHEPQSVRDDPQTQSSPQQNPDISNPRKQSPDVLTQEKRKPRTLPWKKNPISSPPKTPTTSLPNPKPNSSNRPTLNLKPEPSKPKVQPEKPTRRALPPSSAPPRVSTSSLRSNTTPTVKPIKSPVVNTKAPAKSPIQPPSPTPQIETNFTRFARLYNDIPSEKVLPHPPASGIAQTRPRRMIDIFKWRD